MPRTKELPPVKRETKSQVSTFEFLWSSWGQPVIATGIVALLVYYVTQVAPGLVPVPADVNVPFPKLTSLLEPVCEWCGENATRVIWGAVALVAPGFFLRGGRYCNWIAGLAAVTLIVSYLSISAPIDRLLHRVENSLPEEREVPDFLPGDARNQER